MKTENELEAEMLHHLDMVVMMAKILDVYKTPGLSLKECKEKEAEIRMLYGA